MPVIKDNVIMLDDGLARHKPSIHDVLSIIEDFLAKADISYDKISVKGAELIIDDRKPSKKMLIEPKLFTCPHCGVRDGERRRILEPFEMPLLWIR